MKTVTVLIALVSAVTAWSQGGVNFNNRVSGVVDAPVSYEAGGPAPAGRVDGDTAIPFGPRIYGGVNAMVALYYGPAGTPENSLMMLGDAIHFRTGAAAGYFNGGIRAVPGIAMGAGVVFQVRAWDVGLPNILSYEEARNYAPLDFPYLGRSDMIDLVMTSGTMNLTGLQPFTLPVPEPSTVALILLGGLGGLIAIRRRK